MFHRLNRLRELFKASKQYLCDRPPLKWTFRVLYWSPLYMAFVHYGYTIKYVSGKSMQVRDTNIKFRFLFIYLSFIDWPFLRVRNVQPTLNPDSSLGKDLVLFDRVTTKLRHEYKRDDVVALQCVPNSVPFCFMFTSLSHSHTRSHVLSVRRSILD